MSNKVVLARSVSALTLLDGMANSITENLLVRYEGNRVIRGLVQLIPYGVGSAIDVVVTKTLDNIREERSHAFFDELAKTSSHSILQCWNQKIIFIATSRPPSTL